MVVEVLGASWPVFIGLTVLLMGFASFMTGQAVAKTWQPMWQVVPYAILLGFVDRFLTWSLFEGDLFSLSGYIVATLVLLAIAALAYRLTLVRNMVNQYPWLYQRSGLLGWREKVQE